MNDSFFTFGTWVATFAADASASSGWWERFWSTAREVHLDLPASGWGWAGYLGGFGIAIAIVVWMYLRDTANLSAVWRYWLLSLRLLVIAGLAVIALNPHFRDEETLYRPSQVAVLVDTSLSMRFPAQAPPSGTQPAGSPEPESRSEAVEKVFADSPLIRELQKRHEVQIYEFDSRLTGPQRVFRSDEERRREKIASGRDGLADEVPGEDANANQPDDADATSKNPESPGDEALAGAAEEDDFQWKEFLKPRGQETRLGEAVYELIGKINGVNLSGIVVVTDGGSNAGYDPRTAHELAMKSEPRVKLIGVGVGSTEKQANLRIANIQAPTQVHIGDAFEIIAYASGQGLAGRGVEMELYVKPDAREGGEPQLIDRQSITLGEDGVPVEVTFRENPSVAGGYRYTIKARPTTAIRELRDDDNSTDHVVDVVDRKTRVLIVAGGPTREYRFVHNMLYRHSGVSLDIWLQTVDRATAGRVSQESNELLLEFPETRAELFDYDVIVAFDPDWSRVPADNIAMLLEWVERHAGGIVFVGGDVYTPELAGGGEQYDPIRVLYPVFLRPFLLDLQFDRNADQAYPIAFTDDGLNAGFLQLAEDPAESTELWNEFAGFYRTYPTAGPKPGATVYAEFSDPRARNEFGPPILMAGQFYGAGRTFYIGTGELWRLRSEGEAFYDRFWTKVIREVGQGRLKTGGNRIALMPEKPVYYLGETVRVRARVLDAQYQPLELASVPLEVFDPKGRPLVPVRKLERDPRNLGQFVGDFRASRAGSYELRLSVPDAGLTATESVQVRLPNLEDDHPEQNANLLTELVRDTGGGYIPLEKAVAELPAMLDDASSTTTISEQLRLLWDQAWVMYLLVGLLSLEWLTRKLLKLA